MVYVTLISLVLGAILLFAVFDAVAEGLGIFTPAEKDAFKELVTTLNAKGSYNGGQPVLFKKDSPIIGFGKSSEKFFCSNCIDNTPIDDTLLLSNEPYYTSTFMKKPIIGECSSSACVCLCSNINHKIVSTKGVEEYELFCNSLSCLYIYPHYTISNYVLLYSHII